MFDLTGDFLHRPHCTCSGCSPHLVNLWAVDSLLLELGDPESLLAVREDTGADSSDPFIKEELAVAALLGNAFIAAADKAGPAIKAALETTPFLWQTYYDALDAAKPIMSSVLTDDDVQELTDLTNTLLTNGAVDAAGDSPAASPVTNALSRMPRDIQVHTGNVHGKISKVGSGTVLEGSPSAEMVSQAVIDAAKYYTNNYFNDQIIPLLTQKIQQVMDGTDPIGVPDLADVRTLLDNRLKSVPYWRIVANAAASRGYHYGYLKAAQMRGATAYRWVSILDDRTSQICQYLDGREFQLADAVNVMEQVASSGDPTAAKQLMPWRTYDDVADQDSQELGSLVPPIHAACRSTIVYIS